MNKAASTLPLSNAHNHTSMRTPKRADSYTHTPSNRRFLDEQQVHLLIALLPTRSSPPRFYFTDCLSQILLQLLPNQKQKKTKKSTSRRKGS